LCVYGDCITLRGMNVPTKAEIKESLLRSSYPLEGRLEKLLSARDFYVVPHEVYRDLHSGKPTELKLYAISASKVGKGRNYIFPVMLIECINNSVPIAFFVKEQDTTTRLLDRGAIKLAGLPMVVSGVKGGSVSLPEHLKMEEYHHYWKGRVATQFCSFMRRKDFSKSDAWTAFHKDPHFDSFRRLIDAAECQIDALLSNMVALKFKKTRKGRVETLGVEFYYPVLVVQGELLEVHSEKDTVSVKPVKHIQFQYRPMQKPIIRGEADRTSADTNLYRIDVMTEAFFSQYITMVKREMGTTARRLAKDKEMLKKSLAELPGLISEALGYGSSPRAAFTLSGSARGR